MDKTFSPGDIESRWYSEWEDKNYFAPRDADLSYCIPIPPPNVTGTLHMGHGFQQAIMDALIRFHRMKGHSTLWQVGTDHAGIATQMLVERQLEAKGISRHDLGRDGFIDKVWEWKAESGGTITQQLRRLGASVDWSRERFTMDPELSEAVREVFVQLYNEGLIYRGQRLVNWDPKLHTAISDLEVVQEEEAGYLWHLRYPIKGSDETVIVATTRPETMLGDTAVAVNPVDDRYAHLIGQTILLPLTGREIPIIADDYVDADFGSGCVKITPAHDFNDYAMGERHQLPVINILTADACLNENVPKQFQGLDRFDGRKAVVAAMDALGLLEKIDDHQLKVPRGDRSGVVIEPWLTLQWYVDAKKLAGPAIEAVETGAVEFIPKQWENTYFSWMRDIQDWCISRQLWWGHRIPAWYDSSGNVYVGNDEAAVRKSHDLPDTCVLTQDDDVLDTWFSSALWTFSTLGWPRETEELKRFHPASVLVTGFDIIFFWVARMIMMSLHLKTEVPFKQVYVHGLVRDAEGQKMSKSKGNVLDPIDLIDGIDIESLVQKRTSALMQPQQAQKIDKATRRQFPDGIPGYGTDALRYTFYSLASTGRDIKFDLGRMEGFRNFCNKLWNAARYVLMNTEGFDHTCEYRYSLADQWIRSKLQTAVVDTTKNLEQYRFDHAAQTLYDFVWNEYCDWYLELSKPVLWDDSAPSELRQGTLKTLLEVLETTLRLMHPLTPFITEEIWQNVTPRLGLQGDDTIMLAQWPAPDSDAVNVDAEAEMEWLKTIIVAIRTIRNEANIPPGDSLDIVLGNTVDTDLERIQRHKPSLEKLAKVSSIRAIQSDEDQMPVLSALAGTIEVMVPMAGVVDFAKELERLEKELTRLGGEQTRLTGKLSNEKFTARAPEHVVEAERAKLAEVTTAISSVQAQKTNLELLR